jgi:para-nitrobenzyl esterase
LVYEQEGRKTMKLFAMLSALTCVLCLEQASTTGFAQPSTDSAPRPIATVSTGQLRGSLTYDGVAVFKNIPFAEAPTGDLRWHQPVAARPWTGVRDATAFGPACYQDGHLNAVSSEDCLQLNIWTPSWPMKSPMPVMVWFHGGGNVAGSAIEPLFNGENFARHGVILVSANYRLGVFGFFAHPELTKESVHHSSGNYGLLDQIQALRWVRDNIAAFGGDPANVTIFGESAGSMDVNTLITMPMSKGLFQRAIAESGAAGDAQSLAEAEKKGLSLAAKLNVGGDQALAKLRAFSSADVEKTMEQGPDSGGPMLGINVDGWVLPESPAKAFAAGHELPVALLFGNNSQELQKPFGPTPGSVRDAIKERFGPLADRALELYELDGETDPQPDPEFGTVLAQWSTDTPFRCATIQELIWHTAAGNTAYQYQFSRTVHGKESEGAPHAAEIPFVFGTLPAWQEMRHYDLSDRQYAPLIQEYWVNFAKTGDPNSASLVKWPRFDAVGRAYLDFMDAGPVVKEGLRREVCDLYMENQKRQETK